MPATIHAADVPETVAKQLGLPPVKPTKGRAKPAARLDKERVRSYALKCLSVLSDLTRAERQRVLNHAQKVNRL
jgi:hypothetical protein